MIWLSGWNGSLKWVLTKSSPPAFFFSSMAGCQGGFTARV